MEKQIKNFLEFLQNDKKVSENTLQSYRRDLVQFQKYLSSDKINYVKVNKEDIEKYLEHMKDIGKKNTTISRALASIRSFYQYLFRNKKVKQEPTVGIQSPQIEKKEPSTITTNLVEKLIAQTEQLAPDAQGYTLKSLRDKAMLEFTYATGMKVTEIISLNIEDVNIENKYVTCKNGSKQRNIPLGTMALEALKEYLQNARSLLIKSDNEQALFVNTNGKRLTRQGFWKIIKYYKEQAHITEEITPHILRNSFAAHLIQNGAGLESIKEMLGHSDISSTKKYMAFQDPTIQDIYAKAHPRAKKIY